MTSTSTWRLRPLIFFPASKPRVPPASVVFTLWLSRMAAVGVSLRPACMRVRSRSSSLMARHTPAFFHSLKW